MTTCKDHTGELVNGDGQPPAEPQILIPVEKAVREALASYLRRQKFKVHAGTPAVDELSRAREVELAEVLSDFPSPEQQLTYPSASVAEGAVVTHTGGFTPLVMPDTYDTCTDSVLWVLGRAEGTLQVDFWTDSVPVREAIGAQLPALFNPSEGMSGIHLRLPKTYGYRLARYTLVGTQAVDPPDAVWAGERRLQASVRFEAPLLARRKATILRPRVVNEVL